MPIYVSPEPIEQPDTAEQVRDQVAAIIKAEASTRDYDLDVLTERDRPWDDLDDLPRVNVLLERVQPQERGSDMIRRQRSTATYHVDILARGEPEYSPGQPTEPGDRQAALKVQQTYTQVRAYLMAGYNAYLQMRGKVYGRWITDAQMFRPGGNNADPVIAMRITLQVDLEQTAPQFEPVDLEAVDVEVEDTTGRVILSATYNSTGG